MSDAGIDYEVEFMYHLAKPDSLEFILREGMSDDLLISPQTKAVFSFVIFYFNESGKVPSMAVLQNEFPKIEFKEPESTVHWTVEKLRDRYQRVQVNDLALDIAKKVGDPKDAMQYLRDKVFEIERTSLSNRHIWKPGDHKLFIRNINQRILDGAYKGLPLGFNEIDDFTGGGKPGNVIYYMARPKRQKTFMTLHSFISLARADAAPYLSTLENTEEEIMLRISCMLSGVPWDAAQKGNLLPKDWKLIDKAWDEFSQHQFYIEMPPLDERTVLHIFAKADKHDAGPVLVSQFRYLKGTQPFYRAPYEEPAEIAVDLKRAATRPGKERLVIIEAQFNRGGDTMEELEDFDPSKVGLTDMIPQSADTLYGIFQSKDLRANNTIEFGILEARNHGKQAWYIETEYNSRTEIKLLPGSGH